MENFGIKWTKINKIFIQKFWNFEIKINSIPFLVKLFLQGNYPNSPTSNIQ